MTERPTWGGRLTRGGATPTEATLDRAGEVAEPLRIRLLGGFGVTAGAHVVDEAAWTRRKAAALVKLLALDAGHRLHRDQVMDALWPALPPVAALNNLNQAVHAARRALDPAAAATDSALRRQGEFLTLRPAGGLWVDASAFEAASADARRGADPAAYRAALDLYAGDLLPEDAYEDWAAGRREALRDTHLAILLALGRLHEARGEVEEAIAAWQRALAREPADEAAHRALMRLYALVGRRAQALRQYEALRVALRRELDAEPDAASRRLHRALLIGDLPASEPTTGESAPLGGLSRAVAPIRVDPDASRPAVAPSAGAELPRPLTGFVGREREIAQVMALLPATRLLTLTGAGGVGKTRLAREAAARLAAAGPDGVRWVDLTAVTESDLVAQAVAVALGVQEAPGRPLLETLLKALEPARLLLVLDNCEHLIAGCAPLADALLRRCSGVRVLVTSRVALGIAGETLWRVPSLGLPDPRRSPSPADVLQAEAVRLFEARMAAVRPAFAVTEREAPAIADICRRLDGIPLAIELAAARARVLSVTQIAAHLRDSFRLLTGGSRTAPPRHRTLRATLDWSHALLAEAERALLRRLAVFAGGWTLEAAEAVGASAGIAAEDVLDLLTRLVDQSLVLVEADGSDEARYRLLETMRQYAWEKLRDAGEAEATRCRHAEHYLALAEAAAPWLLSPKQEAWFGQVSRDHDNLRLALRWAEDRGEVETSLRLGVALNAYWQMSMSPGEGRAWLARALAAQRARGDVLDRERREIRSRALLAAGALAWRAGDPDAGRSWLEEARALARELGDETTIANAIKNLAIGISISGDQAAARALFEESLESGRAVGDPRAIAGVLLYLGQIARYEGDHPRARAYLEECRALRREQGPEAEAGALEGLAMVALDAGDHSAARACLQEGLRLVAPLGAAYRQSVLLACWACLEMADGRPQRALRLFGAAVAANEPLGRGTPTGLYRSFFDRHLAPARRLVGEAIAVAAWNDGQATPLAEAVAEALTGQPAGEPDIAAQMDHAHRPPR